MRNFVIVFSVIASGLGYGWMIVKHPVVAQIIAGGIVLSFLFIVMVALYETKKGDKPPQLWYDK